MARCEPWDLSEGLEGIPTEPPGALVWRPAPTGLASVHFSWQGEVACNHCGRIGDEAGCRETARWLEEVRVALGSRRIFVSSWVRCPEWNARVGGAKGSYHLRGWAVDITVDGMTPAEAHRKLKALQKQGLVGVLGRYASFVHCDRGPRRSWNGP